MIKGKGKSKDKIAGEEMINIKVQIKQRQCQSTKFKQNRSFPICLRIVFL